MDFDNYSYFLRTCRECATKKPKKEKKKKEQTVERVLLRKMNLSIGRDIKAGRIPDIDIDFLLKMYEEQKGKCFYSGEEMTLSGSSAISIDRKDSSTGYTKENVVLCFAAINVIKSSYSIDSFIDICRKIYNNSEKGKNQP